MSAEMPVQVAEAGIALYTAYTRGLEPSVTDVLVWWSWMTQHGPDVSKDVEAVMTKHGMIREPEWYARATARRSTNRARARHSHTRRS